MKTPAPSHLRCCLLTLSIAGLFSLAASAQTPTPNPISNGKIVFASIRDGNYEIYVMEANGSNQVRLTNSSAYEIDPAWSPDGTKIAFQTNRDGFPEIFVMDANGSNPINLTNHPSGNFTPAWSPDGTKIAFTSDRSGSYCIYVMNATGSNQTAVTCDPAFSDGAADWSVDPNKIAFQRQIVADNNFEVFVMSVNGSNQTNLTNDAGPDGQPVWSPDGAKIAFTTTRTGNDEIFVMDANGANPINLTNHPTQDFDPAWSPDGTKIVFTSRRDGNYEIYVMDANGSNPTRLTNNSADDFDAHWQRVSGSVTPTPIPTVTPSASPTATPSSTPTASPSPSATPTPASPSPTQTPPATPTPSGTSTPTPTPPDSCAWSAAPVYPLPISSEAVSSVGNFLYSFGGLTTGNVAVANSYKFDGTTWTAIAPLPAALSGAVAVTDGTNIYVVGAGILYRYSPSTNTYATLAPPPNAAGGHGAAYLNGRIYEVGGFGTSALGIYDISSNQWTAGANYPVVTSTLHAFADGNFIYGAGGTAVIVVPLDSSTMYRYDPVTNTWTNSATLPGPRTAGAVAKYDGGAVLAGGRANFGTLSSAIFWSPVSNSWSNLPPMLAACSNTSSGVLNGSLYVVGGGSQSSNYTDLNQRLTCASAVTPTPTPAPTLTPTPTPPPPTPTATPTPTSTPTPPAQALNLSTRMFVQTGDNVGIGGFIITGSAPKHVLVRSLGPSLSGFGIPNPLPDTLLELNGPSPFPTVNNDNWRDDAAQEALIIASGLAPSSDLESAIDITLAPGAYTAIVRGKNNSTGVGVVEVFDRSPAVPSKMANISTRAFCGTGNDIVIAGFILGNNAGNDRLIIRGIGPSLEAFGVPNVLMDPALELRDSSGTLLMSNNDWQDDPAQAAEMTAANLAPSNIHESGIATTLPPGAYTALLSGQSNGTGNGVVEVYDRGAP